jgi:hypothetical protein
MRRPATVAAELTGQARAKVERLLPASDHASDPWTEILPRNTASRPEPERYPRRGPRQTPASVAMPRCLDRTSSTVRTCHGSARRRAPADKHDSHIRDHDAKGVG